MDPRFFQSLFDYTHWANRRVWGCVAQLSDEQAAQAGGASVGAILDQCRHTLAVESWWLHFLATGDLDFPDPADLPSREAIGAQWEVVMARNAAYLQTLTAADLAREVRPDFWEAGRGAITLWQALLQVANHSTDHRAHILDALHQIGGPTVGQDYLTYLFEHQASDPPA